MYTLPTTNYLQRSRQTKDRSVAPQTAAAVSHADRVRQELMAVGLGRAEMRSSEVQYLPQIIHTDEHIGGAVFGYAKDGFAILVATNRRVIFLDTKPMFINEDEVAYFVVSGVKFEHAGFGSTVTLHTKIKDYKLRTLNIQAGRFFVEFIEDRTLESGGQGGEQ